MNKYICIHGHFYQPPRENAWLEDIELQDSAFPYHDWNERITEEGYGPNTAARILGHDRHIIDLINNFTKISFNVGPTLLSWMQAKNPEIYEAIIQADKESQNLYSGHGAAIAQVYNHMIMPLANKRDKRTQVLWGIRDFEKRFGRLPEGIWLSETAVDTETLEILAEENIKFTILAPSQAGKIREIDEEEWTDVTGSQVDPRRPYLCNLPNGKSITLFFYDGPVSQEVGFSNLLENGETFANRLLGVFDENENDHAQLVHIATDGETYGHHRPHGDMALAYCLYHIESNELANLTIYGEYLEQHPPEWEVEIIDNTSWSCFHGVERWRSDCGCNTGMNQNWTQEWRAPLREALDDLRDKAMPIFEDKASKLLRDPWAARDEYINVILDRSEESIKKFFNHHSHETLNEDQMQHALKLLEMQRHAMLMYTSCGWFFDEISGIETTQVIQYADRVIQLLEDLNEQSIEEPFTNILAKAPSNIKEIGNGATVYERYVKPARLDLLRVGAHYAIASLFEEYDEKTQLYCYTIEQLAYDQFRAGKLTCAVGRIRAKSDITWHERDITFGVLHLGGHILNGGVREYQGSDAYQNMHDDMKTSFYKSDIPEVIRAMDDHFGTHHYTLWHLFKGERRKVFDQLLESSLKDIEFHFRQIYESDYAVMRAMHDMQIPLPRALSTPMEFILNSDLKSQIEAEELDFEGIQSLIEEFKRLNVQVDHSMITFVASNRLREMMRQFESEPDNVELLKAILQFLTTLNPLDLNWDMWLAQNIYFTMGKEHYPKMQKQAEKGEKTAQQWVQHFEQLEELLQVKVS